MNKTYIRITLSFFWFCGRKGYATNTHTQNCDTNNDNNIDVEYNRIYYKQCYRILKVNIQYLTYIYCLTFFRKLIYRDFLFSITW